MHANRKLVGLTLAIVIGIGTGLEARPKQDARARPDGRIMESPIPPGHPWHPPTPVPDRIGYGVVVLERHPDGQVTQVGLRVAVPMHDLRLAKWVGRELEREAEYIQSIRGAIRQAGQFAGKSEAWIVNAQDQVGTHSLLDTSAHPLSAELNLRRCKETTVLKPLVDFERGAETSLMLSGGATVAPECGGYGARGCGSIVCATPIRRDGKVVGCGNGCGGCAIVTVCG